MNLENLSPQHRVRPVDWLRREYQSRRVRNASYSLRAFSRLVGLSAGALSDILLEKRAFTPKMFTRIASRLSLSNSEQAKWLALVKSQDADYHELSDDQFQIIAQGSHYALLSLLETEDFVSDPRWIAKRLGILASEVKMIIERLERLGFISSHSGIRRAVSRITTSQDIPSEALRESHREGLLQAIGALEAPLPLRDISSITMAIDVTRLPEAKSLIKTFRRDLSKLLEEGSRTQVYNLNIQLVPVTKGDDE